MGFKRTTAINKILAMRSRKRVIQGGTSAGKTYGVIPVEIDYCIKHPRTLTTFVAESIPAVRAGCVKIFKDIMHDTGRWIESGWLGNPMSYTFSNGSIIEFKSFDTIGKAKAAGKRDRLFLNEANHIPYDIAHALMIRSKETTIDFNPNNEFWAHTEVLQEPNSELLILTYKDNEACPPETLEDLEATIAKAYYNPLADWRDEANIRSEYWANWCRVYVLGEIGSLQGTVFQFEVIDNIPAEARYRGTGLDWGYTNDPTAACDMYEYNGGVIFDEILYQKLRDKSMGIKDVANKLIELGRQGTIAADTASPLINDELAGYGCRVMNKHQGKLKIVEGIDLMQERPIYITARSRNFINELRNYVWATDKTGAPLNEPVDHHNHLIDAARYIYVYRYHNKYSGNYSVY